MEFLSRDAHLGRGVGGRKRVIAKNGNAGAVVFERGFFRLFLGFFFWNFGNFWKRRRFFGRSGQNFGGLGGFVGGRQAGSGGRWFFLSENQGRNQNEGGEQFHGQKITRMA